MTVNKERIVAEAAVNQARREADAAYDFYLGAQRELDAAYQRSLAAQRKLKDAQESLATIEA